MTVDDATAVSILRSIAQSRLRGDIRKLPPPAELHSVLAAAFHSPGRDYGSSESNEGELARAALQVLRQDPSLAPHIEDMLSDPAESYFEPVSLGLVTAALVVLQTQVKFKTDHTGKWSLEIQKEAAGKEVLKAFIERILPFLGR